MTPDIYKDFQIELSLYKIEKKLAANSQYAAGINELCDLRDYPLNGKLRKTVLHLLCDVNLDNIVYVREFIDIISQYKIDPNVLDEGQNAQKLPLLSLAVSSGNIFLARLLVESGADLDISYPDENKKLIDYCRENLPKLAFALENPNDFAWEDATEEAALDFFNKKTQNSMKNSAQYSFTINQIKSRFGIPRSSYAVFNSCVKMVEEGKHDEAFLRAKNYMEKNYSTYQNLFLNLGNFYKERNDLTHAINCYQEVNSSSSDYKAANKNAWHIINDVLTYAKQNPGYLSPEELRHYKELQFKFAFQSQDQQYIDQIYHGLCGGSGLTPVVTDVGVDITTTLIALSRQIESLTHQNSALCDENARLKTGKAAQKRLSFLNWDKNNKDSDKNDEKSKEEIPSEEDNNTAPQPPTK